LLPTFDEVEDFVRLDCNSLREAPSQHIIHNIQAFMLGGMQDFQVLLDRGFFFVSGDELVVRHAKPGRGIEMIRVFVVDKSAGLSNQGINHVPKVDEFVALTEQPWQTFQTLAVIPEFQMGVTGRPLRRYWR
jgi:hypothetical protein